MNKFSTNNVLNGLCTNKKMADDSSTPSMELILPRWGGLSTKKFQPECVKEESSTERRS